MPLWTQPNATHQKLKNLDPIQPNPTHRSTQPMDNSDWPGVTTSGGFRGGPSRLRPPPLGDGPMSHALQNTQNNCHQYLSHSFRVQQIRFRSGLSPGPRLGSLQRSPRPASWFKETLLLKETGEEGWETAPYRKFLDPSLTTILRIDCMAAAKPGPLVFSQPWPTHC